MRLLLDTHVVPWRLGDDGRLPGRFRDAMVDADNDVFVSAVSVAESAIKASIGKLDAPDDVVGAVPASGAFARSSGTIAIRSIACSSRRRAMRA